MTAIFYPDCSAVSPDGPYLLEARSPHNGIISHKDGRQASDDEFGFKYREHQRHFRYRLIDTASSQPSGKGGVVWERWQEIGEDSPHQLLVSDDGWSILRTHGFVPEVIAISPVGIDAIRVRIAGEGAEHHHSIPSTSVPNCSWAPENLSFSTAGMFWSDHCWPHFFKHNGRPHFAWRTYWGQRLILDLQTPAIVAELDPSAPLFLAMKEGEKASVCKFLMSLHSRMNEIRVWLRARPKENVSDGNDSIRPLITLATAAIALVAVHRLVRMIPFLREWEVIDVPSFSMVSEAMPREWWLERQYFRPIVHHALRLLGEEPRGFSTYYFTNNDKTRFAAPEMVLTRHGRASEVRPDMSAEQVLKLLGAPDHVRRRSRQEGRWFLWSEQWEYDFREDNRWTTCRITWEKNRILEIETGPSYWLHSDERMFEIFKF